ncbi:MAG: hypothetical protein DRJ42_15815 [Deltaproteobacteria bacterium]|nr:MAG: hypothetical protein DRJ42_15815 [Deltaproteobacteria bacterium]
MAKRVVWTDAAAADLEAIVDFVLERDGVEFAQRLHDSIMPAVSGLADSPERCRVVPELRAIGVSVYRELVVASHRVPFRVYGRDVVIMGVFDSRRDLEELLIRRLTERA